MSDFYIYDKNLSRIGILQHVDAVQWLENYQSPGEVKIDAQATEANRAMLVDGNRIYNPDTGTAARICYAESLQDDAAKLMTVRANVTSALLGDRVVMATENVTNVEAGTYSLYAKNRRGMPIAIGTVRGYLESTEMEITWNSVLDATKRLAEISGLGFKVDFSAETKTETFTVYRGIDRSNELSSDYIGYFGTDVGNIANISILEGTYNYKNVAVVAGAGEGANRVVRIVSIGNTSGENRREIYVDARDLQREYQVAVPTGEYDEDGNPTYTYETHIYTDEQYNALLDARGMEKLAEHLRKLSINCDVAQNNILYGVDYSLGDRVPIKLQEYGIHASARISSVTLIYESDGGGIIVTLSEFELRN